MIQRISANRFGGEADVHRRYALTASVAKWAGPCSRHSAIRISSETGLLFPLSLYADAPCREFEWRPLNSLTVRIMPRPSYRHRDARAAFAGNGGKSRGSPPLST